MFARLIVLPVILFSPVMALGQALADRVPEKVILYAGWQGSESLGADYPKSNLKAFLDDSNIGRLVDHTLPALLEKFGNQQPEISTAARIVGAIGGPLWRHPTAFFLADIALNGDQPPMPHMALITDAGREAETLKTELDAQLRNIPPDAPPIHVTNDGGLIIVSVGYGNGELKLPAAGDANSKSLAHNPAFVKMLDIVGKEKAATFYLDAGQVVATADALIDQFGSDDVKEDWPKARDVLELNSLKQIVAASGFVGKNWGTNLFMAAPAPRTGLVGMLDSKPLTDAILLAIPKNVTMAGAGHFSLLRLLQDIRKVTSEVDPSVAEQLDSGLRDVSDMADIDFESDLLGSLGDEWAWFVDPAIAGNGMSGLTGVNRLHDPVKAGTSLKKMMTALQNMANEQLQDQHVQIKFASTQVGKLDVNYLAIPLITPSWTINNGYLYMGLYPQVVVGAAEPLPVKDQCIVENPAFAELRATLGGEQATSFRFVDLKRTAPYTYGSWMAISHLAQVADLFGIQTPPMILPPLQKLLNELGPAGQVRFSDADGFHIRSLSPFPGSELFGSDPMTVTMPQQAMLISIVLPALNRAREQANRVKDSSNLRQLGLGAMMYANEQKDGSFPPSLAVIAEKEDVSPAAFFSPRSATPRPPAGLTRDQIADYVQQHSDYVWLGRGMKNTAAADRILAYEKMEGASQGINILYADGHVEFQIMPVARQQIEAQQGKSDVN